MRDRFPSRTVARRRRVAQSAVDLGGHARLRRIVLIEDEPCVADLVQLLIRRQLSNVAVLQFEDRGTAWQALLRADPDLLVMDMNSAGMTGWELLRLLAEREVKYPILVESGSFLMPGMESRARQCAGPKLNVTFLTKPYTADFFQQVLAGLLSPSSKFGRRL